MELHYPRTNLRELPDAPAEYQFRVGDYVRIEPRFGKHPFFAWVEAVDGERVTVSHWSYGYVTEHAADEVRIILTREAAAIGMTTTA